MGGAASRGKKPAAEQRDAGLKPQGQAARKDDSAALLPSHPATRMDTRSATTVSQLPQGSGRGSAGRAAAKPWGNKPATPQEFASAEITPRAQQELTGRKKGAVPCDNKASQPLHAHSARQRLEAQEDLSIEQQTAQQYKAFEAEQRRKESLERLEEQEELSIEQQMAQQYKAFEAVQRANEAREAAQRAKLEEQEDLSIEQQMAQQYKAFERQQQAQEEAERRQQKLQAQEDMSIAQQMAQEYKAFSKQREEHDALAEADELLNALAPPQRTPAPTAAASTKIAPRPHTNAQAHAASNVREGARRGGASPPSSRQGTLPASTAARAGHSSKTRGAGAGRGAEAGGVGGVGEWTLERGGDAGDSAALATSFFPDSGDQAMRNQVSCIVPGRLYLTNFRGAEDAEALQCFNITHIVCVNEQSNSHPDKFNYFNIDTLEDQEDHDATPHFLKVKKFTDDSLKSGGVVVFHCAAGISRSATMMIAYLMAAKRLTLYQAFQLCYSKRRVVWPNRSFMQQLIEYEKKLQKDGWLTGNSPTITVEMWDKWSVGEDTAPSPAALDTQRQVKEMERHGSLKGSDSVQFQQYMEFQKKSLTKQEETLDLPKKGSETAKSGTGNLIRSGAKK